MKRQTRRTHAVGMLVGLALLGCGEKKPTGPRPLCAIDTSLQTHVAAEERTFPPAYWMTLLLKGYHAAGTLEQPVRECRGLPVMWKPDVCGDRVPAGDGTTRGTITPDDLHVVKTSGNFRLVWVAVGRYPNGEAYGPVALAEVMPNELAVRSIGMMRALPDRVALRLETVGGAQVVIAEGESCNEDGCARGVSLALVDHDRIVQRDVVDAKGGCLGRSLIPLRTQGVVQTREGKRHWDGETSLKLNNGTLVLDEQLAISEVDPSERTVNRGYVRRAQETRTVEVKNLRLQSSSASLLDRFLLAQAK